MDCDTTLTAVYNKSILLNSTDRTDGGTNADPKGTRPPGLRQNDLTALEWSFEFLMQAFSNTELTGKTGITGDSLYTNRLTTKHGLLKEAENRRILMQGYLAAAQAAYNANPP